MSHFNFELYENKCFILLKTHLHSCGNRKKNREKCKNEKCVERALKIDGGFFYLY